ncbi:MAG: MFS transporter [Actinomycetota bacterium]|nr:MFS transporter [Actinomycetota bacterium]
MTAPAAFDRQWRATTLGMVLVMSLIAFEAMAVATALPTTVAELDGLAYYGWPFTAFLVANILGMVTGGTLGDRIGPRLPLLGGLTIFTGGLLLAGLAPTMLVSIAGRAVQGFGSGLVIVALYVVLGAVYPDRARPAIFAALAAAWVIPALLGPPIAGAITEHLSWRWVFLGLPPFILAGVLLLLPALRRTPGATPSNEQGGGSLRRTGAALGAGAGIATLLYGAGRLDLLGLAAVLAGAAVLGLSARRLLPPGTALLRRGLPAVIGARGLLAGSFFAVDAVLPLTLTTVHGYSPTAAGIPLMAGAVGWSTGSWVQGRYPDLPRFVFVRTGFTVLAAGCLAMLVIVVPGGAGWVAYPIWFIAGLGMGLAMPSVGVLLLEKSPPEQRGANSAAMQIADVMTSALTIGAAGALVAAAERGLLPLPVAVGVVNVAMALLAATGAVLAGRLRSAARTFEPLPLAA